MKRLLIAMVLAVTTFGVLVYAKPERITNKPAIKKNQEVYEALGDIDVLIAEINAATKVDDLKPILIKMLGAQVIEAGKKPKK